MAWFPPSVCCLRTFLHLENSGEEWMALLLGHSLHRPFLSACASSCRWSLNGTFVESGNNNDRDFINSDLTMTVEVGDIDLPRTLFRGSFQCLCTICLCKCA